MADHMQIMEVCGSAPPLEQLCYWLLRDACEMHAAKELSKPRASNYENGS
jgi:hypothetical protein